MSDLIHPLSGFQFGKESTAGVVVPATHRFATLNVDVTPEATIGSYDQQGTLVGVGTVEGQEWVSGTAKGPVDINELPYWADAFLLQAAPVQIGTTAGYSYDYVPSATSQDTASTWSGEWGNLGSGLGYNAGYFRPTDTTFNATRKDLLLDGKLIGQRMNYGQTMTGSLPSIAKNSAVPFQCDFMIANSMAALDGAQPLDRAFMLSVGLANRWTPIWPVKSAYPSYAALVPGKMKADAKLTLGAGPISNALIAAMRAGNRRFLRLRAYGPQIAAAPAAPSAPTGTAGSGGSLGTGTYNVGVAYVTKCGQTLATHTASTVSVTGPNGKITVSSITSIPSTVVAVNIYLSDASGANLVWQGQQPVSSGTMAAYDILTLGTGDAEPTVSTAAIVHMVQIDVAVEVSKVGKFGDTDSVVTQEWEFDVVYDSIAAAFMKLRVVNLINALTY